jgi:hypothetical protein
MYHLILRFTYGSGFKPQTGPELDPFEPELRVQFGVWAKPLNQTDGLVWGSGKIGSEPD